MAKATRLVNGQGTCIYFLIVTSLGAAKLLVDTVCFWPLSKLTLSENLLHMEVCDYGGVHYACGIRLCSLTHSRTFPKDPLNIPSFCLSWLTGRNV